MVCLRRHAGSASLSAVAFAASLLSLAGPAHAAENGLQRYSPGIGGSDMTAPLSPGVYLQVPLVHYHANKLKGGDRGAATTPTPVGSPPAPVALPNLRSELGVSADTYAALPRLTYLSTTRLLGGNIGFTAMLPLVNRQARFTATPVGLPANLTAALAPTISTSVGNLLNGNETGIGDLEVSPLIHWEIGDHQALNIAPTVVLPTGKYDVTRRVNPGFGNFYTFRPSIQYSFIGDGWDFGVRTVFSFNTRNKDNGYRSGNMFNVDWQLMNFISDDIRVGVQGYFVRQLSKDTRDLGGFSSTDIAQKGLNRTEIINGNKSSVTALGPALGWVVNGGEMLIEGKYLQEFGARNRTEGQAFWLSISKPL